ncbi:MAG: aldose 1-epimerase family protein [Planctomycetaceae bacterium]
MTERTVVLTDLAENVWLERCTLSARDGVSLAGSDAWSITKSTLRGGVSDGVDVVELDNGRLSVSVLPTRGMGLWRGECDGVRLGWSSPVTRPVHPQFVRLSDESGLGWLTGFNEWLCRCGLQFMGPPCDDGGLPVTLHGRIANRPAHRVEARVNSDGPGTLEVTGVVDETLMFLCNLRLTSTLRTEAGSNRILIIDEVENRGGRPAEFELLYHINQGPPLLAEGASFSAPVRELAPRDDAAAEGIDMWTRFEAPTAGYAEQVFYMLLHGDADGNTLVLLKNAAGDKGLSLRFNLRELPYFIFWKETQPEADGYVTGLEPATALPNDKPFEREQGRLITLDPGARHRMQLQLAVHTAAAAVADVERQIAELQTAGEPTVHRRPTVPFSPEK